MDPKQRDKAIEELAAGITRRGLDAPARIVLDVLGPVSFLAAQTALFTRPLLPTGRWRGYASALGDEEGWRALQRLVARE
ncbi:MAG: hypothetical protein RLZZ387_3713 [Chloroflexota bacterium]|jgi:hypothetical protein